MNPDPIELSGVVHNQITSLCESGDSLAENEKYAEAINLYWKAWDLLPESQHNYDASTWILVAIGDANFLNNDFEAGRDNLSNAMRCPDAIGNPFIHMRLGQCQFELGNFQRAGDELARAFLLEGNEIFENDDPKYLNWIKTQLKAPEGGWPEGFE